MIAREPTSGWAKIRGLYQIHYDLPAEVNVSGLTCNAKFDIPHSFNFIFHQIKNFSHFKSVIENVPCLIGYSPTKQMHFLNSKDNCEIFLEEKNIPALLSNLLFYQYITPAIAEDIRESTQATNLELIERRQQEKMTQENLAEVEKIDGNKAKENAQKQKKLCHQVDIIVEELLKHPINQGTAKQLSMLSDEEKKALPGSVWNELSTSVTSYIYDPATYLHYMNTLKKFKALTLAMKEAGIRIKDCVIDLLFEIQAREDELTKLKDAYVPSLNCLGLYKEKDSFCTRLMADRPSNGFPKRI